MKKKRLVVLASGRGTNFRAIAEAVHQGGLPGYELVGLISNRADSSALEIAQSFKIPSYLVNSQILFADRTLGRSHYNQLLLELLISLQPQLIALAGYMLILDPLTVTTFQGRIINIHPSLLPKYPGLHPQRQALQSGDSETGCTVHWVTAELDAGPILLQRRVPILPGDTEETLSRRLLEEEHQAYLETLKLLSSAE